MEGNLIFSLLMQTVERSRGRGEFEGLLPLNARLPLLLVATTKDWLLVSFQHCPCLPVSVACSESIFATHFALSLWRLVAYFFFSSVCRTFLLPSVSAAWVYTKEEFQFRFFENGNIFLLQLFFIVRTFGIERRFTLLPAFLEIIIFLDKLCGKRVTLELISWTA